MRKILFELILLIAFVCYVQNIYAEEKTLVVELNEGSTHLYALSDKPVITFNDGNIIINSSDANAEYKIEDVERFYFFKDNNSSMSILQEDFMFQTVDGRIVLFGVKFMELVSVQGNKIITKDTDDGRIEIDSTKLPSGIYILNSDKKSVKIYIK